jgi:hypothetical protein
MNAVLIPGHHWVWLWVFFVGSALIVSLSWNMLRGVLRVCLGGALLILWGIAVLIFSRIL